MNTVNKSQPLTDLASIRRVLTQCGRLDLLPVDVDQVACDRLNVGVWTEVTHRDADGTSVSAWMMGSDLMPRPVELCEVAGE